MEKSRLIWKFGAFALSLLVLAGLVTFTSCNDDEEGEPVVETLAGVYKMTEATLNNDIVDASDSVILPAGSNVTAIMAGGIFGASPCENQVNSAVDMATDGKLYFVCTGDESSKDGVDAGSWEENSTLTELTLTLNATVVPPIGFVLTITDVTLVGAVIDGTIGSVPMPSQLLNQVPGLEDVEFPLVQTVGADVKFTAVPSTM